MIWIQQHNTYLHCKRFIFVVGVFFVCWRKHCKHENLRKVAYAAPCLYLYLRPCIYICICILYFAGELEKSGLCSSVLGGGGKKKKKKRRHRTIFTSYQVRIEISHNLWLGFAWCKKVFFEGSSWRRQGPPPQHKSVFLDPVVWYWDELYDPSHYFWIGGQDGTAI